MILWYHMLISLVQVTIQITCSRKRSSSHLLLLHTKDCVMT